MWTSRVNDWYMAITGHFIHKNMVLQSLLLECCALDGGSHTGTVLAQELRRIVHVWNIEEKNIDRYFRQCGSLSRAALQWAPGERSQELEAEDRLAQGASSGCVVQQYWRQQQPEGRSKGAEQVSSAVTEGATGMAC
ncbi:hypothetical protein HF086_000359 [Spodoptera exigua]|uniref:Uncharacterized protein n=1 Tax=Spodoptera exigua TaxID=7107 RepID=A0A922MAA0_SPOEX|nr:hypothetical protein HF086_000359 [Spodoptera exigua]